MYGVNYGLVCKTSKLFQDKWLRIVICVTPEEREFLNTLRGNDSWKEFAFGIELAVYRMRQSHRTVKKR